MVVNPVGRHSGRSAFRNRSNIAATNFYIQIPRIRFCFSWKFEIFLPAKSEVELIHSIAAMENIFDAKYLEMVRDTMLDSEEVR